MLSEIVSIYVVGARVQGYIDQTYSPLLILACSDHAPSHQGSRVVTPLDFHKLNQGEGLITE